MVFVWVMTSRSKHFMTMGVSAIEWQTLRQVMDGFFGIGIMVAVLKHTVTTDCASKMLKMSVRTTVGWVKHPFSIPQGMRSVSVALTIYRVLFFLLQLLWQKTSGHLVVVLQVFLDFLCICDLGLFYPSSMVVPGFSQCFTFNFVTCPESSISCFEEGANLFIKPRLPF